MRIRIVKDKRAGEGFTIARTSIYYPADRKWWYSCWFATKQEAREYLMQAGKAQ